MLTRHVLVTGAHRSGTTWVGRTLAHHPNLVYMHEPFNANDPNRAFGARVEASFYYVPGSAHEAVMHAAFDRLLCSLSRPYQFALSKCQGVRRDFTLPLRFGTYLLRGMCRPTRALIKDPFALISAGWLHTAFDLHVICLIRNPLAFAGSLKRANWPFDFRHLQQQTHLVKAYGPAWAAALRQACDAPGDIIDQACLLWNLLHTAILRHRETYPHWLFVRHEDLARRHLPGFQQILTHVGLRMTPKLAAVIAHETSAANPAETTSLAYMPRNALGSLETWRTRLTAAEITRVIHAPQDIADHFYERRGQAFV